MDELRDEIANLLIDGPISDEAQIRRAFKKADRILAIPEIAEALATVRGVDAKVERLKPHIDHSTRLRYRD